MSKLNKVIIALGNALGSKLVQEETVMGFKRSSMNIVIQNYVQNNPQHRKYFYCEKCGGKMVFRKNKQRTLECCECGKEVEDK